MSGRSAIVLGAGMAGMGAALQLRLRGWSVALVDRGDPGRETSYGNAGLIQAECVEPFEMPRSFSALRDIARGRSNHVHYEWRALLRQAGPLLGYWWNSATPRHRRIAAAYAQVIRHATAEHGRLIDLADAGALVRRDGFRVLYRTEAALAADLAEAERLRATYGVAFRHLEPAELQAAEPALREAGAGAIHWLDPWSVSDPGALVASYGDLLVRSGGTIVNGEADTLAARPGGGWSVRTSAGIVDAEAAVVALGPWSPDLLRRFGYGFPMVRKRGYHTHYRAAPTLDLPLVDPAFGYAMAPMAKGLRITTGAEFARPDAPSAGIQLARAEAAAGELVRLGGRVENAPWSGTRPCMPDMLPVIGRAPRHPGLWLHFGHGHQGFTLGPATGRLLAEMMTGETPYLDPLPYRPERFRSAR